MSPLHLRILKWISNSRTAWNSIIGRFCVPGSGITPEMIRHALQELEEMQMLEKHPIVLPWENRPSSLPHVIDAWLLTEKAFQYLTDLAMQKSTNPPPAGS